jgi:hypothetical protein
MDKKEKKNSCMICVMIGFWTMLLMFVLMMVFSFLKWQWPSLITGILFIISIFFVFVSSIKAIFPENTLAYVALGVAIVFIMYLLLSATIAISPSVLG